MAEKKPKARTDGAKIAFLAIVGLCAGAIVALLWELPETWRTAAILWLLVGLPLTLAGLRVWHGYVTLQLEAMARAPQHRPPASLGVEECDRGELRVVEGSDGHHGRQLL